MTRSNRELLLRMRRWVTPLMLALVLSAFGAIRPAHSEEINWRVFQNQPVVDYFENVFSRDYPKLLKFDGKVENPSGLDGALTMFFDYVDVNDPAGVGVVTTDPITIQVPENSFQDVSITYEIPFCPAVVSLHARTADTELLELTGTFTHECLVPEPATGMAAVMGLMSLGLMTARRRR